MSRLGTSVANLASSVAAMHPIVFIGESQFADLASKDSDTIYFVDDNSIYKGSELYAAASFDELHFSSIEASSITVDGNAVALDGHSH